MHRSIDTAIAAIAMGVVGGSRVIVVDSIEPPPLLHRDDLVIALNPTLGGQCRARLDARRAADRRRVAMTEALVDIGTKRRARREERRVARRALQAMLAELVHENAVERERLCRVADWTVDRAADQGLVVSRFAAYFDVWVTHALGTPWKAQTAGGI